MERTFLALLLAHKRQQYSWKTTTEKRQDKEKQLNAE